MPLQRLERIPSGIPGFDDLIEGGFKVGSINLLAGSAGSGKTIFSIQFLVEGIKRGEAGVYITFEEKREKLFDAIITQMQVKRLVIDSITSFALLFQDQLSQKESALALFELINNWGCTALLTSQATQISPDDLTSQLEFEVDGIILLYHFKKQGIRQRALEILKMRGTKTAEKTVKLTIDEQGVRIDPKTIVMV